MTAGYYIAAAAAGALNDYSFILAPDYVLPFAGKLYLASLPMLTVFWLIAVCISTPIFSVGVGLVSIVPSVLINNTKAWFLYPMGYPFYLIMTEYGEVAENIGGKPNGADSLDSGGCRHHTDLFADFLPVFRAGLKGDNKIFTPAVIYNSRCEK